MGFGARHRLLAQYIAGSKDHYIRDNVRTGKKLKTLSRGLAEVVTTSDTRVIQFIHQSVKDVHRTTRGWRCPRPVIGYRDRELLIRLCIPNGIREEGSSGQEAFEALPSFQISADQYNCVGIKDLLR